MASTYNLPYGHLIVSDSFQELAEQLSFLPRGSLVKFDVDNTLAHPEDLVLRDPYHETYQRLRSWYNTFRHPHHQASYCHVDEFSASWIRSLRERGVCVIAFTGVSGRHPERGDYVPDWRSSQLQQLGFEFSDADLEISFEEMDSSAYRTLPLFKKGVLYSAERPKGDVLEVFLKKRKSRFPHAVLIDDAFENLISVAEKMRALQIPFTGVLYTKAWKNIAPLDEALASRQICHFASKGTWDSSPTSSIGELEI